MVWDDDGRSRQSEHWPNTRFRGLSMSRIEIIPIIIEDLEADAVRYGARGVGRNSACRGRVRQSQTRSRGSDRSPDSGRLPITPERVFEAINSDVAA